MASISDYIRLRPSIAAREFDGELVVIVLTDQSVHFLNGTAATLFRLVDGRRTGSDLVSALRAEFAVDEEQATSDVLSFISDLVRLGIVESSTEPAPEIEGSKT